VILRQGDEGSFGRSFGLDLGCVREWLFCPGMVFQDAATWWGDRMGSRPRPHEGVDLLLYRDHEGRVCRLDQRVRIPVVSEGTVVGVIRDFLGRTVLVEHPVPGKADERRYTIYAHTRPLAGIAAGAEVNRGDLIATVAVPQPDRRFPMAAHLHLSVAWAARPISCDRLDWDAIAAQQDLALLDPLAAIGFRYQLLGEGDPACGGL
jgi:hypothetical protein